MRAPAALLVALLGCAGRITGGDDDVTGDGGVGGPDAAAAAGADAGGQPDASLPAAVPGEHIFDLGVLHEIEITVDDTYLDALENDRENRVPCTFSFDGVTLTNVGIRQKGGYGSSSTLDGKPPFSVKLNEFVLGQRLDGMEKVILNNAQEDPTFVSEHVGYEMHRRAGLWATRTAHGVVALNGRVYGIYVVKEAIAEDFLERTFGKDNDGGNLYEGFYHPEDQPLGDFVTHPEQLDLKDEVEDGRTRDDVVALAAAIDTAADDELATVVGARFDLDAYITQLALDSLLGYWDSYHYFLNNYYLYDNPADGRFVYLPHGMDQLQYDGFDDGGWPMGRLAQRIRDIPALDARFAAEKDRLASEIWDTAAIDARIDQVGVLLHSTSHTEDRVLGDIDSYDAHAGDVEASFAARAR